MALAIRERSLACACAVGKPVAPAMEVLIELARFGFDFVRGNELVRKKKRDVGGNRALV